MNSNQEQSTTVFSIGHSNLALEKLIFLLRHHNIDVLVDVRSHPYSRIAPQFNKSSLKQALEANGIKYGYSGKTLGGKPDSEKFYDARGHVLYGILARSPEFKAGIQRLKKGIKNHKIALMCSEEDPVGCHRRLLIGRVLKEQGICMKHIRASGQIQTEDQLQPLETAEGQQLSFLESQEDENWRSVRPIRSASQSGARQNSLAR